MVFDHHQHHFWEEDVATSVAIKEGRKNERERKEKRGRKKSRRWRLSVMEGEEIDAFFLSHLFSFFLSLSFFLFLSHLFSFFLSPRKGRRKRLGNN